jgi:hypothetical protein
VRNRGAMTRPTQRLENPDIRASRADEFGLHLKHSRATTTTKKRVLCAARTGRGPPRAHTPHPPRPTRTRAPPLALPTRRAIERRLRCADSLGIITFRPVLVQTDSMQPRDDTKPFCTAQSLISSHRRAALLARTHQRPKSSPSAMAVYQMVGGAAPPRPPVG